MELNWLSARTAEVLQTVVCFIGHAGAGSVSGGAMSTAGSMTGGGIAAAGGALIVMEGGHGQWFVQRFAADLAPRGELRSLLPGEAVGEHDALIIGNRADAFVARRGSGTAVSLLPDARAFPRLRTDALFTAPSPIYGRAPDAKPMARA